MPESYFDAQIENTTAAGRISIPDDIAYIIRFLSSKEGHQVNGAAISANRGNKLIMSALDQESLCSPCLKLDVFPQALEN